MKLFVDGRNGSFEAYLTSYNFNAKGDNRVSFKPAAWMVDCFTVLLREEDSKTKICSAMVDFGLNHERRPKDNIVDKLIELTTKNIIAFKENGNRELFRLIRTPAIDTHFEQKISYSSLTIFLQAWGKDSLGRYVDGLRISKGFVLRYAIARAIVESGNLRPWHNDAKNYTEAWDKGTIERLEDLEEARLWKGE